MASSSRSRRSSASRRRCRARTRSLREARRTGELPRGLLPIVPEIGLRPTAPRARQPVAAYQRCQRRTCRSLIRAISASISFLVSSNTFSYLYFSRNGVKNNTIARPRLLFGEFQTIGRHFCDNAALAGIEVPSPYFDWIEPSLIVYWAHIIGSHLTRVIPARPPYATASLLAPFFSRFWTRQYRCASINMERVLGPHSTAREVRREVENVFRNYARYMVDLLMLPNRIRGHRFARSKRSMASSTSKRRCSTGRALSWLRPILVIGISPGRSWRVAVIRST